MLFPLTFLCIAAAGAGMAGHRSWLYGPVASPWFLLPSLIDWNLTASPDQMKAYGPLGGIISSFCLFCFACSFVGVLLVEFVWFLRGPRSSLPEADSRS